VRILDYNDISPQMVDGIQLLDLTAGWGLMDLRRLKEARRLGYPAADYFGVYAVENGKVESMIRVLRLPFATKGGTRQIAAIQGVVTRRDRSRLGLARRLMQEVFKREREAGSSFALLWTSRSNVAHGLYNSLGYADVYTPELAVRWCGKQDARASPYRLRKARAADWALIERLHREATKGRVGFTPRPEGIVRSLHKMGFLEMGPFRLVLQGDKPVGYGFLHRDPGWSVLDEMALLPGMNFAEVLSLFEAEARGTWLTIRNTVVRDSLRVMGERSYSVTELAYYGLLAAPLEDPRTDVSKALGTASPAFTCQRLDYF